MFRVGTERASSASSIRSAGIVASQRKARRPAAVARRNSPLPVGANMTSYALPVRRIQRRPIRCVTAPLRRVSCCASRWSFVNGNPAGAARERPARAAPTQRRPPQGLRRAGRARAGCSSRPRSSRRSGSGGRWGAPDPSYRHAMPVLGPIESCRRARSSGVGCAKITHMKRTVATSNSVNVSTARTIGPRHRAPQWSHRVTSCVGDEYARRAWCEGLDGRAGHSGRSASSSPPKSHATTAGPIGIRNPDVAPVMPSTR